MNTVRIRRSDVIDLHDLDLLLAGGRAHLHDVAFVGEAARHHHRQTWEQYQKDILDRVKPR
jgi:hypothetical protein